MQRFDEFTNHNDRRRSPMDLDASPVPGFYRVCTGSLVEIGDQTLDERGWPRPVSLDEVGREVTRERVVLRIERRQPRP